MGGAGSLLRGAPTRAIDHETRSETRAVHVRAAGAGTVGHACRVSSCLRRVGCRVCGRVVCVRGGGVRGLGRGRVCRVSLR